MTEKIPRRLEDARAIGSQPRGQEECDYCMGDPTATIVGVQKYREYSVGMDQKYGNSPVERGGWRETLDRNRDSFCRDSSAEAKPETLVTLVTEYMNVTFS